MIRRTGFVIYEDFQILDLTGPMAAFEVASRHVQGAYEICTVSRLGGPVRSSCGLTVIAEPFGQAGFDTLVVVGGWGVRAAAIDPKTLAFVERAAKGTRRMTSVCSGTYVLAAAGLLDGKTATTHWRRAADLARRFPKINVEPDRIFVRDGAIWTSAGITAGIDLALAMIGEDLGESVAAATAKELVVHHRRPGGQSQFSAMIDLPVASDRVGRALAFARARLAEPLSVEMLAQAAGLSPRQFSRTFLNETGLTPAKAVERLRVEAARAAVEAGRTPIDRIALVSGFGDPERMRRAFVRAFGQPPQAMRRAAHATGAL
jgi:transcriptional regulator GlxA family with amidase domain